MKVFWNTCDKRLGGETKPVYDLWLRAKTEAKLKSELKMKVVWNTCDKELGDKIKSVYENCFKSSSENFQKSRSLLEKFM